MIFEFSPSEKAVMNEIFDEERQKFEDGTHDVLVWLDDMEKNCDDICFGMIHGNVCTRASHKVNYEDKEDIGFRGVAVVAKSILTSFRNGYVVKAF